MTIHRPRRPSPRLQVPFIALILLCCAASARASSLNLTIINATFSATCIGGGSTCTEVVNGSAVFDTVTNTFSNISLHLTGTLAASLNSYVPNGSPGPPCVSPNCLQGGGFFYDSGVLPAHDPIEFGPALSGFPSLNASPLPLTGGASGTAFYIPTLCGGDQPLCNTVGSFPSGDFVLTSGTYTLTPSVPEPGAGILLATGAAMLGFLRRKS